MSFFISHLVALSVCICCWSCISASWFFSCWAVSWSRSWWLFCGMSIDTSLVDNWCRRWSRAATCALKPQQTIRSTVGERSFQSAAAFKWNVLPRSVRSSTSVLQFRSRLKTELFARSYQQFYWICPASVTPHFCSVILKSLDLHHVNDDYNTN